MLILVVVAVDIFGYAYPNDDMQLNSMVTAGSSSCLCYDDRAGEFVGYYVQKHYPIKNAIESASPLSLKPVVRCTSQIVI